MTQYLTRRELRELERSGKLPQSQAPAAAAEFTGVSDDSPAIEVISVVDSNLPAAPQQVFLSRRELRAAEQARAEGTVAKETAIQPETSTEPSEPVPVVVPDVIIEAIAEVEAEAPSIDRPDYSDISTADFTGSNLLAEPSTQSLVLDVAPEAISLPIDTLDGTSTGSIAILPDPSTGSLTGALDGLTVDAADRVDAVTGVISLVEPVSAIDVINQRVTVGVVPDEALRKGAWQSWAYATLGVLLGVATIIATIAIINAVGE